MEVINNVNLKISEFQVLKLLNLDWFGVINTT